jgi:hypothetical protein
MVRVRTQDDIDHERDKGVGGLIGGRAVAKEAEDDFAAVEDADYFVARRAVGFDFQDF